MNNSNETNLTFKKISLAKQFSATPGGRYRREWVHSGEEFREKFLEPVLRDGFGVEVDLDGVVGVNNSFLEEVFGGLIRKYGPEIKNSIRVESRNKRRADIANDFIDRASRDYKYSFVEKIRDEYLWVLNDGSVDQEDDPISIDVFESAIKFIEIHFNEYIKTNKGYPDSPSLGPYDEGSLDIYWGSCIGKEGQSELLVNIHPIEGKSAFYGRMRGREFKGTLDLSRTNEDILSFLNTRSNALLIED